MGKHSKNNNASSVFTYGERQMLKQYGTQKMVVGRDSMRNYDACFLCLQTARDPLCCNRGHMMCKECIYENILMQRKEIARLQQQYEEQQRRRAADQLRIQQEAEDARKFAFAAQQDSFINSGSSEAPAGNESSSIGGKLKEKIFANTSSAASELNGSHKSLASSFWVPSMAPEGEEKIMEQPPCSDLLCPHGQDHTISIKKMIPVNFTADNQSGVSAGLASKFVCPSCRKSLSNSLTLQLPRQCGHVLCKHCTDQFVRSTSRCFVCEGKCREKDLITLEVEGTGFSSKGGTDVKKYDLAFKA